VITELGTHAELVAAGGTYAEMFRIQAEAYTSTTRAARSRRRPEGDSPAGAEV
jgi:hypothetical protein